MLQNIPFTLNKVTQQTANIACHDKCLLPVYFRVSELGSMYSGTDKCVIPLHQKAAQFTNHKKNFDYETLVQRRTVARLCVLFKAFCGERAWKAICDTQG